MPKLAIFFDGTWNTPNDRTNVYKLYKLLNDIDPSKQQGRYIQGVGTREGGLFSSAYKFLSGAFGDGLSDNIQAGYRWLVDVYEEGDEIFLFGFSRGAYSARSLSGMIRNCGILRKENSAYAKEAYGIYRDSLHPESEQAKYFRSSFSYAPDISFVGVWDTVGSLGIPVDGFDLPGFQSYYKFHDTKLSDRVRAAYHALAVNEFRSPYAPTLWTKKDDPGEVRPAHLPVEQRWFIGAHSNVGGGYIKDTLCNLSCRWLQAMAQKHGLEFLSNWPIGIDDYKTAPRDSYTEFIAAHPNLDKLVECQPRPAGGADSLHETVDPSVIRRINADAAFLKMFPALGESFKKLPVGED
jgi:uncharacterized protein (DUF2235 family)